MLVIKGYYYVTRFFNFWKWNRHLRRGGVDLCFAKYNYEGTYSFAGVSENDFYTAWLEKIEKIKEACYPFDFRKNIEFWCERIVEDYVYEKEEIKHYFLKLDLVSLKILKEILEGHDQQYKIIFNNCTDFSGFLNAIDFLEHLPYKLKIIMVSIIENQKEIELNFGEFDKNRIWNKEGKYETNTEGVDNFNPFLNWGSFCDY